MPPQTLVFIVQGAYTWSERLFVIPGASTWVRQAPGMPTRDRVRSATTDRLLHLLRDYWVLWATATTDHEALHAHRRFDRVARELERRADRLEARCPCESCLVVPEELG